MEKPVERVFNREDWTAGAREKKAGQLRAHVVVIVFILQAMFSRWFGCEKNPVTARCFVILKCAIKQEGGVELF